MGNLATIEQASAEYRSALTLQTRSPRDRLLYSDLCIYPALPRAAEPCLSSINACMLVHESLLAALALMTSGFVIAVNMCWRAPGHTHSRLVKMASRP